MFFGYEMRTVCWVWFATFRLFFDAGIERNPLRFKPPISLKLDECEPPVSHFPKKAETLGSQTLDFVKKVIKNG